jgi:polyisoprenoid-binding protein YceI
MTTRFESTLRLSVATALVALSAQSFAAEYNSVDVAQSKLAFGYTQMGVGMEGAFKKFSAQLAFDPAKPESGHASIDVQIASIDAGSPDANSEVVGKQWFDAQRFPVAHFETTNIKSLGNGRYTATGKLTIKGRTQPVTAPVTFTAKGKQGLFEGALPINRADFAIGEGPWADFSVVANQIQIRFKLQANASN